MKAPKRRIDNAITRLGDSISLLLMHAQITKEIKKQYSSLVWRNRAEVAGVAVLSTTVTGGLLFSGLPPQVVGGIGGFGLLGAGALQVYNGRAVEAEEKRLLEDQGLVDTFRRTHVRQINEHDEFVVSIWNRIKEPLKANLNAMGIREMGAVSNKDIAGLQKILDEDIPALRRLASPAKWTNGSVGNEEEKEGDTR